MTDLSLLSAAELVEGYGPRHADALVLRAGRAYERTTAWHTATPSLLG
jgi:hypothetical protein